MCIVQCILTAAAAKMLCRGQARKSLDSLMFLCSLDHVSKAHFLSINCYNRQLQSRLLSLACAAATQSLLSTQGLHPLHLRAEQNRSDLHRGARHHLQGAALCAHLGSPPLELRWPAGEDLGLPEACAHVRFTFPLSHCQTEGKWSWTRSEIWF